MTFDSNEPLLGIGIAAKKLGVSPELLRLYEREGLVVAHKTKSGHRLYSERDLEWIDCFREQITKNKMKDRKSTRLNSSHIPLSRMPSSA